MQRWLVGMFAALTWMTHAAPRSSSNYIQATDAITPAGLRAASASYTEDGSIGEIDGGISQIGASGVVKQGFATDWGEADEGIHCVAAPIRDRQNVLVATIWVSGIAGRMPRSAFASVAVEVVKAAGEIERRLRA